MANLLAELQQKSQPAQPMPGNLLSELQQMQGGQNAIQPSGGGALPVDREPDVGALGALEAGTAIATGIVAEPIAGISGLVSEGLRALGANVPEGGDVVKATRELLTFSPRTEEGQEALQSVADTIEPVGKAFGKIETSLGEAVLEATGSPELAAIAHSLPTAALEAIGVKGLRSSARLKDARLSSNVSKAITQAAPDINVIKRKTKEAYDALDNTGIKVQPKVYENFANRLQNRLKKEGIDPDLHPKASAAMNRIMRDVGQAKTPSELETLRKIAKDAAGSIDKSDARLGTIIVNEIDKGLDNLSSQIGGKFKEARGLAQRAFKSQVITDMIENASHTASGLENGLRIEARKILKNKNKRRGFTKDEIDALKKIEQGTSAANIAKFLGKFGISEGQATSMLGASIGIGGGGAIGSAFGAPGAAIGALTVPAIGQAAKKTAQRITLNNTKFADDLVRAGKNARDVARAYIKNVPARDRRISDLTDLFLAQDVDVSKIKSLPQAKSPVNKLISDAAFFADEIKRRAKQAGSVALIASPELNTENE